MTNYVDDADCEHGVPRDNVTRQGMPKCPMCRRRAMYELRDKKRRPAKPKAVQPQLDVAALAAHDDSVIQFPTARARSRSRSRTSNPR